MKRIYLILFFSIFFYAILRGELMGYEKPSIKIIYSTGGETELQREADVSEEKPENFELKYDKAFKDTQRKIPLAKNKDDYMTKSTDSFKANKALDTKKITQELYQALIAGFLKKGFPVNNEEGNYIVSFTVNEVTYDDLKGECYIRSATYKLIKNSEVIYEGNFIPSKKKPLFGGNQYTQLVNINAIANSIVNELSEKIIGNYRCNSGDTILNP